MAIDFIEEVRKHIGTQPIPKIDPNTQSPKELKTQHPDLGNAIIPPLLIGFYKRTRDEEHAVTVISQIHSDNILDVLFTDQKISFRLFRCNYYRNGKSNATYIS